MDDDLFSKLAVGFGLSNAHAFSQEAWRAKHYTEDPGTLCSGLTNFWLKEKICSRSPMSQIKDPNSRLLQYVKRLQALSYYPNFPKHFIPGEREKLLLMKKYGQREWNEIRREVDERYHGDYVLYDLSRMYGYEEAEIRHFEHLHQINWRWLTQPANSVAMCVLRYRNHGQSNGHRIAYYFDRNGHHHFFDPNNGEVMGSSTGSFFAWLNAFFSYTRYANFECTGGTSLTLYLLKSVVLQETILPNTNSIIGVSN